MPESDRAIHIYWSDKEKEALKKLYPRYLRGEISRERLLKIFNRTIAAIMREASELGFTKSAGERIDWEEYKKQCQVLDI